VADVEKRKKGTKVAISLNFYARANQHSGFGISLTEGGTQPGMPII
jgi:hypothetical protein